VAGPFTTDAEALTAKTFWANHIAGERFRLVAAVRLANAHRAIPRPTARRLGALAALNPRRRRSRTAARQRRPQALLVVDAHTSIGRAGLHSAGHLAGGEGRRRFSWSRNFNAGIVPTGERASGWMEATGHWISASRQTRKRSVGPPDFRGRAVRSCQVHSAHPGQHALFRCQTGSHAIAGGAARRAAKSTSRAAFTPTRP